MHLGSDDRRVGCMIFLASSAEMLLARLLSKASDATEGGLKGVSTSLSSD